MDLTASDGLSEFPPPSEIAFGVDQVFITDHGVARRADAFYYLALGHHVFDNEWNELYVRDFEQELDHDDVMNPVILRGLLWKTLPERLWQVDDGHQFGPLPAQPGLDSKLSTVYYDDRRRRQRGCSAAALQQTLSPTREAPLDFDDAADDAQPLEPPRKRRCQSMSDLRSDASDLRSQLTRNRARSVDGDSFDEDTYSEQMDEAELSHMYWLSDDDDDGMAVLQHSRQGSVGLDSGIDLDFDEDDGVLAKTALVTIDISRQAAYA